MAVPAPPHPFALKRQPNVRLRRSSSRRLGSTHSLSQSPIPTLNSLRRRNSLRMQLHTSLSFKRLMQQQKVAAGNHTALNLFSDTDKQSQYIIHRLICKLTEIYNNHIHDVIFVLINSLATNLCLIIGIQFALMNDHNIDDKTAYNELIKTSIVGIFGGALSNALGEYMAISAVSEATLLEIDRRKEALEEGWDDEMDVLRDILSKTPKEDTIDKVMDDFQFAARDDVLELDAKLALGIDPDGIGNGFVSGLLSFVE